MSEDSPGGDTPLKPERTPMKPGIRSLRAAAAMGAAGSPLAGLSTPQHKPAAGLGATGALAHRHELAVSAAQSPAGTPHTPAQASPHVQAAFKEIVASPSPKVSMLVERLKQKEAKHVEAIVVERDREQKRAAMLAEAQKVRAARKKAAVESEANYAKAEELRAEADSELARQRQKSEAARHNYHELVAKRDGSSTSASHGANQIEEQALIAAEKKHKQRVKEAERARAAMTAARAEHDKALRMEQAFLDVQSEKGSGPYPPESQRSEELFTALSPPQSSDVSSPLSGLQVMSPLSANASLPLASPCEAAAEEERLAWWAMEEYEAVMEEERKRDEAERREKMKRLEAAEEARREEERKQREERVRHERETKQRALELEIQARRDREREEFERQERERAEAEERELKKRQEAERREMEQREQQRLLFEQQRQEEERQERLERERKTKEVQDCGRAMIAQLMSSVRSRNLSGAQEALKALHKFHVVESIFVTDEQRVEEQQASGAVHVLESQHAEMYHERILLIERGEADLEAASTALKSEDLSTARDLVRSSLERLKEAAVPCVFEDIWRDLEQRIEGDVEQAQALLQEVVVRDDCISSAEQHVQDSRARLAAGDWMAARALLQEARKELRRAQMSRHDAQLKALTAEIDAAEQLQLERNAEEERRRDMVNNGETQLASACAAMSEGDIPKARALLREARVNFEQAEASKELFDEIASMQQRVDEAEDLLRRKAAIEQERHRNLSQGQLKLQECRRALDTLEEAESEGSIIEAKALLQAAKEAFWRANNHAMDAQVGLLERAIEAAELREQQQLEVRQRAAAQVRAAEEHWRRAVKEMASNGNVEEVEHLLRSARAALAALHDIPNGIDVAGLQMRLDEAEDELVVVREMRVGEDYLRQSQEALARGDLEAVELSLAQARAAFGRYGEDHPLALNGLSACRTVQANVERSRRCALPTLPSSPLSSLRLVFFSNGDGTKMQ